MCCELSVLLIFFNVPSNSLFSLKLYVLHLLQIMFSPTSQSLLMNVLWFSTATDGADDQMIPSPFSLFGVQSKPK